GACGRPARAGMDLRLRHARRRGRRALRHGAAARTMNLFPRSLPDTAWRGAAHARVAPLPRVLWIELTSRCPFDCVFCSRKLLRGAGRHMDFALYGSLIAQLREPDIIRLNYSGESAHYPKLVEACT